MKTLVIYAHPNTKGFCSETLQQVEDKLKDIGEEYEIIDLYKIDYDPLLREEEHYTAGNRNISQQNLEIQQKIKDSKNLIFIYPVWWMTMPAVLKGFFDRILTSRFAYSYEGGKLQKLLADKKAVAFVSSGGSRKDYFFLNIPKFILKKAILGFCGIETKFLQVFGARNLDNKSREKIRVNVEKGFKHLNF